MFRSGLRLPFTLLGIPVRFDFSFLLILPLFAWLIGSQVPAYVHLLRLNINPATLTSGVIPYLLGLAAAIGLFISVLIHELGHAVVARRYGVQGKEITLWFLGGMAQFNDLPKQRGAEAIVGIAGPITSFLLALICGLVWRVTPPHAGAAQFVLSYLTAMNVLLGLFNLLPALPLDGGRVLRSLLALKLEYLQATRVTATVSQIIAILMGLYGFFSLDFFLVIIAFFIYSAVRAETMQAVVAESLKGVAVGDIMTKEVVSAEVDMRVAQLRQLFSFTKHHGYPVIDVDGRVVGFIKPHQAEGADDDALVASIMTTEPSTISAGADALAALQKISGAEAGRLAVTNYAGKLVGILSRSDLLKAIHARSGAPST